MKRLQLGAMRLEKLPVQVLQCFLDERWVHLGDSQEMHPRAPWITQFFDVVRAYGVRQALKLSAQKLRSLVAPELPATTAADPYASANFREWRFQKGDTLPFADGEFSYVFSEHFLEHLFLDEAIALLRECYRVMAPGAVIRVCVPDADLRTYRPPEPVGYPHSKVPYTHPYKHKSRWSVYSLGEALAIAGFTPIPLTFCDKEGRFLDQQPRDKAGLYPEHCDAEVVFDTGHIRRRLSLIVDGVKP